MDLNSCAVTDIFPNLCGIDRSGGPILAQTANDFQSRFHKPPPSNPVMLVDVRKFRLTSVL